MFQRGLMEEVILEQNSDARAGISQAGQGGSILQVGELWTMTNRLENPRPGVGTGGRFGTWSWWRRSGWERRVIPLAIWGGFTEGILE